jgi:hypothetical protein
MQKSFRQLTNKYEELQKVIFRNGTHYPESTDRVGTPHPELRHLIVHQARNGKHVWSYHPELSRIHDRNLIQLMGGQKIVGRNNVQLPNRLVSLQKPTVSAVRSFASDLIKNPDRHVMSANTDPTKPADHSEMRVRHLISALTGSDGYEIKDHPEGFEVYAPRHSKSQKADDIATRWIYNAAKKDLRSERIYPTSPNGGSYGTKFGKSIGPRPSSNLGRRQANARKPAAQRPRPFEDAVGKNKTLVKSLKQLTKEYETLEKEIKTVYHGSKTPIDSFSQGKANEQVGRWGHGVYFADHKPEAKTYGKHVYQTQIDTDKHLDLHDDFDLNKFNEYAKNHPDKNSVKEINDIAKLYSDTNYIDVFNEFGYSPKRAKVLSDFIQHLGYDGVRYEFANPTKLGYAMMLPLSLLLPNIDMTRIPKKNKGTKNTQSYYTKFNTDFPVEPSNDNEVSLKKAKPLEKTRGTLTFPKILPKDTRPEEGVKQIPKKEPSHQQYGGLYSVQPAKQQFIETALRNVPPWQKLYEKFKIERELKQTGGLHFPYGENPKSFAFRSDYHIKAHEGIHATITKIANHFGTDMHNIYDHVNSFIHEDDKKGLSKFLKARGYKDTEHKSEYVPFIHSILHDKNARNSFLDENYPITLENEPMSWHEAIPETETGEGDQPNVRAGRQAIQRLGRTWRAIQSFAREATASSENDFAGQSQKASAQYKVKKP